MAGTSTLSIPPTPHIITAAANLDLDKPGKLSGEVETDAYHVLSEWINSIIRVKVPPDVLRTVVQSSPGLGTALAAYDVVVDVKDLASRNEAEKKWGYELPQNWLTLAIDLIGFAPGIGGTVKGFKPALTMLCNKRGNYDLVRQHLVAIGMGNAIDKLTEVAEAEMPAWPDKFGKEFDRVVGGLQGSINSMAKGSGAIRTVQSMAQWLDVTDPVKAVDTLLYNTRKDAPAWLKLAVMGDPGKGIDGLQPLVLKFVRHGKVQVPVGKSTKAPKHAQENQHRERPRNAATGTKNEHVHDSNEQFATRNRRVMGTQDREAPNECCPRNQATKTKSAKTGRPVHIATGQEVLYQTDFTVPGLVPVDFTRCYRSSHSPYDDGPLGARWTSPYTTAITQTRNSLIYHDATGRNVTLPLPAIGEDHDVPFESFTLRRDSATIITLTYRSGDHDLFRTDGQVHHDADGHPAIRYALRAQHTLAGPTLQILPAAEARRRFQHLPIAASLDPQALLVITDAHQLWLQCLPADADHFAADSPAAKKAVSDLADLHAAHQQAGIAHVAGGDAAALPSAWRTRLAGRIGSIVQLLPDGSRHTHVRYRYSPALDAAGNTLPDELDLVEQRDAMDQARSYAYACPIGPHLLTRYTDYNGFGHNLEWHADANWAPFPIRCIRTVADNGSEDTRLIYRPERFETEVVTPDGVHAVYQYNCRNLIVSVLTLRDDDHHPLEQRLWDSRGNLVREIDAEGRTTRYAYDERDNLVAVTDAAGATTRYAYDSANRPLQITDPAGEVWLRRYDAYGNLTAQTDPAGHTSAYAYNALGQLTAIEDAKGGTTALAYNGAGQLVSHTDCSGRTTRYSYTALGHLAASTDAAGHTTRYEHDRLGQVIAAVHADGSQTQYTYDALGNIDRLTDAAGHTTRFAYTPQGQLAGRTDANGHTLAYRYNAALQLVCLTNQNGESYEFRYDDQGALVRESGFDGKVTEYAYNDGGQLIESRSGNLRIEYDRDDLGRLTAKRVCRRDDPTHVVTTRYQYDVLGRLQSVTAPHATHRYTYDDAGNLVGEEQRLSIRYGGDRLTGKGYRTVERVFTLKHEVDELGNRIETILPNGRKVTTQRYGSGHWIGTLWNGNPLVDLERDELHRERVRQLGGKAMRQTRSYDPLSRLTKLKLTGPNNELLAFRSHTYDAVGNLTRIEDSHRDRISYEYDPLGQLLKAVQTGLTETFAFDPAGNLTDGSPQKSIHVNKAGKDHDGWEDGLDYLTEQPHPDAVSRPTLAPVKHNLLKRYLGMTFDHDEQGNTVRKIVKGKDGEQPYTLNLHYDGENRLVKAVRPQGETTIEAEYRYDALGRRIAKIVSTMKQAKATGTYGASSKMEKVSDEVTFFVCDGDTLVQEVKQDNTVTYLYEPDSFVPLAQVHSNTPDSFYAPEEAAKKQAEDDRREARKEQEAENLKWLKVTDAAAYEQALKTIAQRDEEERQQLFRRLEEQAQSDRIYYVNTDHLGTPQEVVSPDGKVVWLARYKAWGRVCKLDKAEVRQPLRFQGQYEDEETGLYYNRHRYYDPDTARYLTQDPIGLAGGDNLYQYVSNSTAWIDPLGLAGNRANRRAGGILQNIDARGGSHAYSVMALAQRCYSSNIDL